MKNLVDNLNYLKKTIDTESALRSAAETEFNQNIHNGPMSAAHLKSIQDVIAAAQLLIQAAQGI